MNYNSMLIHILKTELKKETTIILSRILFLLSFFFGGTGIWTQGCEFKLTWTTHLALFALGYFLDIVPLFALLTFPVARITDLYHYTQYTCWDGV
jgi:hypothetical protein